MNSIERGVFEHDPSYDPERLEARGMEREQSREKELDLRLERDVFQDHERIDNGHDADTQLAQLRDTLVENQEGILHLAIPEYEYDVAINPFIGMGPDIKRTYSVSRYLDVVFLHRFVFQDILVCGLRSREFVSTEHRASFARHIRDTGGVRLDSEDQHKAYDFLAQKFAPYVTSDTTAAWFTLYHKQEPLSAQRPHYPLDIWVIYDANAYDEVPGLGDFRRAYRLKSGYERRTSVLGIAQIN